MITEVDSARAIRTFLGLAWTADRWRLIKLMIIEMVWRGTAIIGAYGLKMIIDAITLGDRNGVIIGAVVTAAPLGIQRLGGPSYVAAVWDLTERLLVEVEASLAGAVSEAVGIEHLETPKYLDEVMMASRQRGMVTSLMRVLLTTVQSGFLLITSTVLLSRVEPWALLLPVFGIPGYLAGKRAASITEKAAEETAEATRRRQHIYTLASSADAGKELRIFGSSDHLIGMHSDLVDTTTKITSRAAFKGGLVNGAAGLIFTSAYVAIIASVIQRAIAGSATVGDIALSLTLASQINGQVSNLAQSSETFARITKTAKRFVGVLDYPARTNPKVENPQPVPTSIRSGIRFDSVTFGYEGSDALALHDVSTFLPANSVVALVGENGAGKTTLVKLLSRMYEPRTGSISVDGVDISQMDPVEWRSRISAAFQDFVKFELTVAESVGVGDLARGFADSAVLKALERAGALELADAGPSGLATQLGKRWDQGIELSGGQWQKLALARALMRDSPLLLIFDEPTAALDAETEHALFERFAAATRVANANGAITLLVSHRFSTVRMADSIVVMEHGKILQAGSHDELMDAGGLYKELYELQAHGYR